MDFNILGVGVPEMILIFLLMITIAGPKRMIKWAYELGKYTAKFRAMFQETMDAFKREIDASDLDLSKEVKELGKLASSVSTPLPRFDIVKEANKVVNESSAKSAESTKNASSAASANSADSASANTSASTNAATNTDSTVSDDQPRYDSWQPK
ncbi:MAG: hypothetical protein U0528_02890 [Anaerolineae bacterium]|nr:hypothetical protein [Anaerolineae bacterium]